MEERKKLMTEEEFKEYMNNSMNIRNFACVSRFKSVLRAVRRGHLTQYGTVIPDRPFNNRKATKGRKMNELKKSIYYELTRGSRQS